MLYLQKCARHTLKILYAASNNPSARIQLSRFIEAMNNQKHTIKIAAYKVSSPKYLNVDWTLDALLNIYKPELLSLENDNLAIYYDQVKSYNPELVISDLEYFTSYVANILNITLWQCSSSLINHALTRFEKYNLGLFKYHAYSLNRDPVHTQRTVNLIDNSNLNLVYSHYGDTKQPPALQDGFEWIRPYHQTGKKSIPCQHNIVAGLSVNDKDLIDVLSGYPDCVAFSDFEQERYRNLLVKDIRIADEYSCNLKNCACFACQGQASFLADAFYNGKYSFVYPNYDDTESLINSRLTQSLGLGRIMNYAEPITESKFYPVDPSYHSQIRFLDQRIEEL